MQTLQWKIYHPQERYSISTLIEVRIPSHHDSAEQAESIIMGLDLECVHKSMILSSPDHFSISYVTKLV